MSKINSRIEKILKEIKSQGKVKILTMEESYQITKEIGDEMEKVHREYLKREAKSERYAEKTYFNC